jgi:hypothetical protein
MCKLRARLTSSVFTLSFFTVLLGFASAQEARSVSAPQAAVPAPPLNPLKIGLLHWYKPT